MNKKFFLLASVIFTLFSCATTNRITDNPEHKSKKTKEPAPDEITLLFAGDIMAHTPNFSMKNYDKIWKDVKPYIADSDLAFANIEAPVCETLPYSSYPAFNLHADYIQAAINAGFNVFSLANNHTNDQYLKGINGTIQFAEKKSKEYEKKERKLYFSGLKKSEADDFSYCIIEKNGWKILYVAVTQLLNRPDYSSYINYVPGKNSARKNFLSWCKNLREENPCDLFILSLHTNEEEYIRKVTDFQENWYNELLGTGIDIVWANHAHIIKKQILIPDETEKDKNSKLIMCANGNTISGQRTKPNLDMNFTERDDTGDGLFYKTVIQKDPVTKKPYIKSTEKYFITTYKNTANEYIIKPLDDEFIEYLKKNRPEWAEYITKRKEICEGIE